MAYSYKADDLCEHFVPGSAPIDVHLVLDEHLGFTDALVGCRLCDAGGGASSSVSLLAMIDWQGPVRAFRLGRADPTAAGRFLRDLDRGSCDVHRAGEQARHFRLTTGLGRRVITLDTSAGMQLVGLASFPEGVELPVGSWRDLSCDGSWIDAVRQIQDTSGNAGQARS